VDDAGRTVRLPHPARRVVALLPAGTEMLLAIGAGDRVVGRTRYDTGAEVERLPSVGGGLDPSLERLVSLRPELVVDFETAGGSRLRSRLESLGIAVFSIAPRDTATIFRDLRALGRLVGRGEAADSLSRLVHAQLDSVRAEVPPGPRPAVMYVASVDPPIVAGSSDFLGELIGVAGGVPVLSGAERSGVSPQLSPEAIVRLQPDVVMLPVGADTAAEVAQLRRAPGWRELRAVREGRIAVVPQELTDRPGPRIAETARVMREALRRLEAPR
jgi:iron complex transport system substrate-binding protein